MFDCCLLEVWSTKFSEVMMMIMMMVKPKLTKMMMMKIMITIVISADLVGL